MSSSESLDRTVGGGEAGDRTVSAEVATAPPRVLITGGGQPDAAELAALIVALTPGRSGPPGTGPPAWRRAAMLEGVGGAAILSSADLEVAAARQR